MAAKPLTDAEAQRILLAAEKQLDAILTGSDPEDNPRLQLLLAALRAIRIYSKSGNEIPGYGGLGLHEALATAQWVLEAQPQSDREVSVFSYKGIFQQFLGIR